METVSHDKCGHNRFDASQLLRTSLPNLCKGSAYPNHLDARYGLPQCGRPGARRLGLDDDQSTASTYDRVGRWIIGGVGELDRWPAHFFLPVRLLPALFRCLAI